MNKDISTSTKTKAMTTAHLIHTVGNQLGHTKSHFDQIKVTGDDNQHHYDHANTHLNGGIEHVQKLIQHLTDNYPEVKRELTRLDDVLARPGNDSLAGGKVNKSNDGLAANQAQEPTVPKKPDKKLKGHDVKTNLSVISRLKDIVATQGEVS